MQAKPSHLKAIPDENKASTNQIIIELASQISSSNSPYPPIYQSIPSSANNQSEKSLIFHKQKSTHNHDEDDKIPFPELPGQEKNTSSPHTKDKSKAKNRLKSLGSSIKQQLSAKCSVKKFFSSFILILMLANLAILIPLTVYYSHNKDKILTPANGALSYIAFNLVADPILDIKVHNDGASCPQDYQSLLLGTWPGTTPGCECSTYLRSGYCYRGRGTSEGSCTDIDPINSIGMYDWEDSKWCMLKAEPGSQYVKAVECPKGFNKCSSGICVVETLDCPVTKVEMPGGAISTESVEGESPVIGFSITPNDIPCFSDDYFARGPIAPYVLIDENEHGCGKYGSDDQYSFALSQQKQNDIFGQNNFPMRVYNLPDYAKVYKKTDSVLSYRKRLSVAEKDLCLNINPELLEQPSKAAPALNKFLHGTVIAAIVIHGVLVAVICFILSIEICLKIPISKILKGKASRIWLIPYLVLGLMEYIDLIVMFVAIIHYRAEMIETQDYLAKLGGENCLLDLQAQTAMSDFHIVVDVVDSFFKYSLSVFLLWSFVVFPCVYLLWKQWK